MTHKLKIYFLQHRISVLMFVAMTTIIATLALVFAALIQINRQSEYNQQILKGLSCILLILPEERTEDKVRDCIKVNSIDESNFLFKTLDNVNQAPIMLEKKDGKTVYVLPVKGDKGDTGAKGDTGDAGASIKGDKGDTVIGAAGSSCGVQQVDNGASVTCTDGTTATIVNGTNGETILPRLRCNVEKNRWEIRYSEEDNWTILDNQVTACTVGG